MINFAPIAFVPHGFYSQSKEIIHTTGYVASGTLGMGSYMVGVYLYSNDGTIRLHSEQSLKKVVDDFLTKNQTHTCDCFVMFTIITSIL